MRFDVSFNISGCPAAAWYTFCQLSGTWIQEPNPGTTANPKTFTRDVDGPATFYPTATSFPLASCPTVSASVESAVTNIGDQTVWVRERAWCSTADGAWRALLPGATVLSTCSKRQVSGGYYLFKGEAWEVECYDPS